MTLENSVGRKSFYFILIISLLIAFCSHPWWQDSFYLLWLIIPYAALGFYDHFFSSHNVLRNYPVFGHIRYLFEFVRPEIQQYFVATNQSGRPFNREIRSVVYQRAKGVIDTLPFGTQQDITHNGYELAYHSLAPASISNEASRLQVGNAQCQHPYLASRLNISAMSFGALSSTAVEAMNWGAQSGHFAHNTGEGGLTPYHLKHGGDIIWQIGTAYFGCRTPDGQFAPNEFQRKACLPNVKMIEIKLSQGAKPSHGGILPAAKLTPEIAFLRGVELGKDCISPPRHSAFSSPEGLLHFVAQLRKLSGGKPVGFKICIGVRKEFMGICKAMLKTGILPDFITVDGAEGGTGAAPLEFSNRLGTPINEAIAFVHSCLLGIKVRDSVRIIASGKIATGFDIITKLALGADMCNAARAMMFATGCIQALRCHMNTCPTGVATQDPHRKSAVIPKEKSQHVASFHEKTINSFLDILGAMGIDHPDHLNASDIYYRMSDDSTKKYSEIFTYLEPGALLGDDIPAAYANDWEAASAEVF
jgi:glutamate synthase domain-containing protein 2